MAGWTPHSARMPSSARTTRQVVARANTAFFQVGRPWGAGGERSRSVPDCGRSRGILSIFLVGSGTVKPPRPGDGAEILSFEFAFPSCFGLAWPRLTAWMLDDAVSADRAGACLAGLDWEL